MKAASQFYKNFFRLCLMLALQNVVTISVNLADNIMLGGYSEAALSGAAAVNQIQFVYQQLLIALGDGIVIFCSQYWGKGETESVKHITAAALRAGLAIALLFFLAVTFFPGHVLSLFTTDPLIIEEGTKYLNIIRFTYIFFAANMILLAALRSVEIVKIAFMLSVLAFFVNCGINYMLIYGRFGMPELGIKGAAVGTLAARIVEFGTLVWYLGKREKRLKMKLRNLLKTDMLLNRDYFRVCCPLLVVQGLWGVNTALQTVILGHMTSSAIAANSVASTVFLLMKSMAVGAASAGAVIIGKTVGSGDIPLVRHYAKILQKLFLSIGIVTGLILFLIRIPILSFYDLAVHTREMADNFLKILSVVCVGMSYQMPTNNGIIRGGGNAAFAVKMDLISIWGIVIPLSFFMAFVVHASPVAVVWCLNADQIFKCVPAFLEANYGNWIRKLTK